LGRRGGGVRGPKIRFSRFLAPGGRPRPRLTGDGPARYWPGPWPPPAPPPPVAGIRPFHRPPIVPPPMRARPHWPPPPPLRGRRHIFHHQPGRHGGRRGRFRGRRRTLGQLPIRWGGIGHRLRGRPRFAQLAALWLILRTRGPPALAFGGFRRRRRGGFAYRRAAVAVATGGRTTSRSRSLHRRRGRCRRRIFRKPLRQLGKGLSWLPSGGATSPGF
jgi:hypothetical protein